MQILILLIFLFASGKNPPPAQPGFTQELSADVLNATPDPKSESGFYVPKDLADALQELDRMLPQKTKDSMKTGSEEEMIDYHFGLGTWIRNNWGLWRASRLAKHFHSSGIKHPDDMSAIILTCYWQRLNGINDTEKALAKYREEARKTEKQTRKP